MLFRVSVIVPIHNGEADLPDLINCLKAQTYPTELVEYLLVDNNSCDRTSVIVQAAAQDFPTIRHLTENQIQSSYAARNTGIRAATGEILAFTDVDCRPQPNWLKALIEPFTDSAVGIVAGRILAVPGKTLLEKYAEQEGMLCYKQALAHHFCPYGATANLAIRRKALEQVGLFRSYLSTGGDADLCWRIQQKGGWQICGAPNAVVQHRHRSTLQEFLRQWRRYGHSHKYLHELHGVDLQPELTKLKYYYYFGKWLLKLPIKSIKLIIGKSTFVDLLKTPIYLMGAQARTDGQREATLPKQALEIELL